MNLVESQHVASFLSPVPEVLRVTMAPSHLQLLSFLLQFHSSDEVSATNAFVNTLPAMTPFCPSLHPPSHLFPPPFPPSFISLLSLLPLHPSSPSFFSLLLLPPSSPSIHSSLSLPLSFHPSLLPSFPFHPHPSLPFPSSPSLIPLSPSLIPPSSLPLPYPSSHKPGIPPEPSYGDLRTRSDRGGATSLPLLSESRIGTRQLFSSLSNPQGIVDEA